MNFHSMDFSAHDYTLAAAQIFRVKLKSLDRLLENFCKRMALIFEIVGAQKAFPRNHIKKKQNLVTKVDCTNICVTSAHVLWRGALTGVIELLYVRYLSE